MPPQPVNVADLPVGSGLAGRPMSSVRLHIVTGKGGTGKTTVAAALALAIAGEGKRVLLAEVEGRQGISQTFDVPPLPVTETPVAGAENGGQVVGLAVDAKTALLEYLQLFYKLGRAGGVLERFGAIDFATTIAPGVRDLLLIGRIYEASRRRHDLRHSRDSRPDELVYDAIVLDAPPTGRIPHFLSVGGEVADLARMGPIHSQADSVMAVLQADTTMVHLVTLLEEMPVQETVDAVTELRRMGMPLGVVVINQTRAGLVGALGGMPDIIGDSAASDDPDPHPTRSALKADLRSVGIAPTVELLDGLIDQVTRHAEQVAFEDEQLEVLRQVGLPVVSVPYLVDGIDLNAVAEIAELLVAQDMTS